MFVKASVIGGVLAAGLFESVDDYMVSESTLGIITVDNSFVPLELPRSWSVCNQLRD